MLQLEPELGKIACALDAGIEIDGQLLPGEGIGRDPSLECHYLRQILSQCPENLVCTIAAGREDKRSATMIDRCDRRQQRTNRLGHINQIGILAGVELRQRFFDCGAIANVIDCVAEWHGHLVDVGTRCAGAGQIPGRFRVRRL